MLKGGETNAIAQIVALIGFVVSSGDAKLEDKKWQKCLTYLVHVQTFTVSTVWLILSLSLSLFHFLPLDVCSICLSVSLPACKCNGHASVCQVLTGKCFCTTKGIKGDQCQLWVLTHLQPWTEVSKAWYCLIFYMILNSETYNVFLLHYLDAEQINYLFWLN